MYIQSLGHEHEVPVMQEKPNYCYIRMLLSVIPVAQLTAYKRTQYSPLNSKAFWR